MKKAKRLLAVLLASLMLFTAACVPSYAYQAPGDNWHNAYYTEGQKYYFDYNQGASWVLDFLDDMLFEMGLCLNADELDDLVADAIGIDLGVFTSPLLLNLDNYLVNDGIVDESGQGAIDIRSVDNLVLSLYSLGRCLDKNGIAVIGEALGLFGDLLGDNGLKFDGLNTQMLRRNGVQDRQVLEMLINWLTNQKSLLQGLLGGELNWGSILEGLIGDLLNDLLAPVTLQFNDGKINANKLIKDLLYTLLINGNASEAPTDGSTIDDWVQHLIDRAIILGTGDGTNTDPNLTHGTYGDGGASILGPDAEPLMPAVAQFDGGASITSISVYQFVNNIINGLFGGTLKDLLADLLYDLLGVEITPAFPKGDPAVLQDSTYTMIIGIVQGLFEDNGAPKLTLTGEATQYPVPQIDALLDWLLVGNPAEGVDSALDTFILIDYYGFHIQSNFMSLLNDVARLLINLLPSLGLFSSSAHLAYTPDDLTVSWYIDDEFNLVDSNDETKVTQTYVTFETNEVVYPTEFVTDANGAQQPSAYCYLDDKSSVNTTDASAANYMDPALIRPNYVITTNMVFANIIKLAINDFIEGCYFPEWTTDIPSVLAYGLAAMAAPIVPENNYYERLDAYHAMLEGEVAPIGDSDLVPTAEGGEVEILRYSVTKVITIKDINGKPVGTANVQVPKAALDIIASFGAKRLNGVFHFDTDADKFATDTSFEQFLGEFIMWAANQYMPAFVGEPVKQTDGTVKFTGTNADSTNDPIFASAMTALVNAVYSDYTAKTIKQTANWDAVYDFIDSSLFKLLPTSWLPHINGSSQFLNQWLFENLVNFNLQGILNLFQVNEDPDAELNNSLTKVLINVIDRVLALVFNDNAVLITSGQVEGRQGAVMNNNVTTIATLAGLLDCSGKDASLPRLVTNLLTLLNRYKTPLLGTVFPLILGGEYIKPYTNADGVTDEADMYTYFTGGLDDLKKYKISHLEDYLAELNDNKNAVAIKTFNNIEDAEAAVAQGENKPMAIKNADGVRTDILLSTGTVYGTYASRDEANAVLDQLKDAYIEEVAVDEANGVYEYKLWTSISYLTSANATPASDAEGDAGDYTEYSGFSYSQARFRTTSDPFVRYDDDYYFFQYEDFGKSGFLYNNRKDANDSGYEFVDSYYSFAENDLVDAYGAWYMFWVESELKKASLYDSNGDGVATNSDTTIGGVTYYADGNPGVPSAMYPYYTTSAGGFTHYDVDSYSTSSYNHSVRSRNGFIDPQTGKVITNYNQSMFNAENFEQIQIALDYAAERDAEGRPVNNVVLSDEDAESVIRLWLRTVDFDITLNGEGAYNGATQWEDLTEAQLTTIRNNAAEGGFTFDIETDEETGEPVYRLARPAFALIQDGVTFGVDNVVAKPELSTTVYVQRVDKSIAGTQTYVDEIEIAKYLGYYEYIKALYSNRIQLLDEIDELSWRIEKAESSRSATADTTVLEWTLDLVEDDYRNPVTRKRNTVYIQDENGNNVESKQFTTSSYIAFRNAYDYASDLYDAASDANLLASGITQSMVTAAYQGLLSAWMALVEFTGFADWTQIHNYITIAEEILNDPFVKNNDPDFGVASGLEELETALKDAYVYADNLDNPDTVYDLNKKSEGSYDSEKQDDIDAASALLNQAIQSIVYNKIPSVLQNPDAPESVKIQDTKYENQIQYAHIYGLDEGVGFGDGTLEAADVLEMLGLKVSGMTIDGSTSTVSRTNSARGSGTDARLDGRYQNYLRFRYFAILYGDINGDTRIDNTDASALKLYIAKNENKAAIMGEAKFEAADVTHDGGVDAEDVQAIVNHYSLVQNAEIVQDEHSPVALAE